ASFQKRFFRYFNAFRMIQYMHYMRDHHHPDVPVMEAVTELFVETGLRPIPEMDGQDSLEILRQEDRN
ncbi:MAG TPA: hypothetical protein VMZ69_00145, partial [Saprospiraceae bacterium]|nr:hypothetical protein [Saprospiraceae bacterium]